MHYSLKLMSFHKKISSRFDPSSGEQIKEVPSKIDDDDDCQEKNDPEQSGRSKSVKWSSMNALCFIIRCQFNFW